ncbi:MAG TPA: polymer-forming cytoskeletal protein [Clostridiaceae bacterium]|nr:polymer-forming cytoskeletal protein [Clostridiaceae bacterium]
MLNKKNKSFNTVIGADTIINGDIKSDGSLRIDGKITGNIEIQGDLFIGSSAVINGNITAHNIELSGMVVGNVHSENLMRMLSTAKLYGDMQVNALVADEGAFFKGKCSMPKTSESAESASITEPAGTTEPAMGSE